MFLHLIVSGYVQGVGYRWFVKKTAITLGLTGWVKNLPDRKVEVLASGSKERLEMLVSRCKKGPFLSKINDIKEDWIEKDEEFSEFSIIR
jgi:acylphosphatase